MEILKSLEHFSFDNNISFLCKYKLLLEALDNELFKR